jgi:hypothetical protein
VGPLVRFNLQHVDFVYELYLSYGTTSLNLSINFAPCQKDLMN